MFCSNRGNTFANVPQGVLTVSMQRNAMTTYSIYNLDTSDLAARGQSFPFSGQLG